MKYLFWMFLFLAPVLIHAKPNQKNCEAILQQAFNDWNRSNELIEAYNKNGTSQQRRIELLEQALECCQQASNKYTSVLNHVTKKHYGKSEWQKNMQKSCQENLVHCAARIQEINGVLNLLKWNQILEEANKESDKQIQQSIQAENDALERAQSLKGKQKIPILQEAIGFIQKAAGCNEELLSKTFKTGDYAYQSSLKQFQNQIQEHLEYQRQTIRNLEKEIVEIEEILIALQEKLALLKRERILFSEQEMPRKLYEIDKRMESIFEALLKYQVTNDAELALIQMRIAAFESVSDAKRLTENPPQLSQEEYWEREKIRRAIFFKQPPFLTHTYHCLNLPKESFVISLDGQHQQERGFSLYENQFYRFLFIHPESRLLVRVSKDKKIVYEEELVIPLKGTEAWEEYLTVDGMVYIPKTRLQTEFALDIQVSDVFNSFLIAVKGISSDYQFCIFSEKEPSLCPFYFSKPPPSPLAAIRKPAPSMPDLPLDKVADKTDLGIVLQDDFSQQEEFSVPGLKIVQTPDGITHLELNGDVVIADDAICEKINSLLREKFNQATVELRPHPLLDAFVEEMNRDPLALAQYVHNEIDFLDPFLDTDNEIFQAPTFHRSALGTFLEGQGTPWEQCALLIYFLRTAGYRAHYIEPEPYLLPKSYVEKLLFVELPQQRKINYPGVLFSDGEKWVTLYPWMKEVQLNEGRELYGLMDDEYATADRWIKQYLCNNEKILKHIGPDGDDTAGILFVRFVEEELRKQGLSLQDVGAHRSIRKKQFVTWSDFPRPHFEGTLRPIQTFIERKDLFAYMQIEIASKENPQKKLQTEWTPLADLNCHSFSIHVSPVGENRHLLHLKKTEDSNSELLLELDPTDRVLDVQVSYAGSGKSNTSITKKTLSIAKGTRAALCLQFGNISAQMISLYHDQYKDKTTEEERLQALLPLIGARYFEKCNRSETILARLHKIAPKSILSFGLVKLSPDLSNGPLIGEPDLKFPQVDMYWITSLSATKYPFSWHREVKSADRQFSALCCADTSSNEHQILREVFQDPYAISTVKLLQIAHSQHKKKGGQGIGFLAFTSDSFAAAEKMPEIAQCIHFPHLKELSLPKLKTDSKEIWDVIRSSFGLNSPTVDSHLQNSHYSYVYMTPGHVLSEDGDLFHSSFYKGIGALIIHPEHTGALISDNQMLLNGGYGSSLPNNFIQNLYQWEFLSYKDQIAWSTPGVLKEIETTSSDSFDPLQAAGRKSDIRQEHKSPLDLVFDPIDVVTGAFYVDELDLTLPGPFPLQLRRNYNSQNPIPGLLGHGWKISLNPFLVEEDNKLYASEEDGTVIVYRFNPERARWIVFTEDNPNLTNFSHKGIGSMANPFHSTIEKKEQDYILHRSDGSKRTFENHRLKKWVDHAGNTLCFSYDQNILTCIESSNGSFFRFHYNYEGKIEQIWAKDGRRIKYSYDSQNNLREVILPNDAVITYEYDRFHQIIRETKPHGKVLENVYQNGQVVEQRSPVGLEQQMTTTATLTYQQNYTVTKDAQGHSTTYRMFQNRIYKVTDPEGHEILQSWFIDHNTWFDAETESIKLLNGLGGWPCSLKASKDKRGLTTEYFYDDHGNPKEITLLGDDLTGNSERKISKFLNYNERNLCTQEKTLHKTTRTTYDSQCPYLPSRIEQFAGDSLISYTNLEYNLQGLVTKEDHCGQITLWEYDARGFLLQKTQKTGTQDPDVIETYRHNAQGQCTEKTTADAIVQQDFDIMGNNYRTQICRPSGDVLSSAFAGYNLNNQISWKQGADSKNILFLDYNASGCLKATRQSLTQANASEDGLEECGTAYTLYEYDNREHLIQEVNPLGFCTSRAYDALGRLIEETKEEITTRFTYEAGGMVETITSPGGGQTRRCYTTNGLLKKEIFPDGTENRYIFDFFGRPIFETKHRISWKITYDDAANQITRTHLETGVTEISRFDTRGNLIAFTNGEGFTGTKSYDGLNRLKAETSPDGTQTTWDYLGDTIVCHLPSKEKTIQRYEAGQLIDSQTFNAQNELIAHVSFKYTPEKSLMEEIYEDHSTATWTNTLGLPVLTITGNQSTVQQYDAAGNCIVSIDGKANATKQQFDALGRIEQKELPDGAVLTYDYDSDSNLIACCLPGKLTWVATYDLMGRKVTEELQADGKISERWTYTYDQGYLKEIKDPQDIVHTQIYDSWGRIKQESANGQQKIYAYDKRGALISLEQTGDEPSRIERAYNASGQLSLEKIYLDSNLIQESIQTWEPSTRTLKIGDHERTFHLEGDRLSKITTDKIELGYRYSTSGALVQRSSPIHSSTLEYNDAGLPKETHTQFLEGTHHECIQWDRTGKLASCSSPSLSKTFTYTPRGHLKTANEEAYEFDFTVPGRGIRTKTTKSYIPEEGLDPFGRVLTEVIENKILTTTYSANGEVETRTSPDGQQCFTWDPWGRLTAITSDKFTWRAFYDPLGRRLQTTFVTSQGKNSVVSLYDPEEEFQEIGVQCGGKTFWKLYGPNSCDALIDETGDAVVLIRDILGNLITIGSPQNNFYNQEYPSPYGYLNTSVRLDSDLLTFAQSLNWQSKSMDPTGFICMGARYYDPQTGRFLSPDPVSYPLCLDLYAYANGDPINFTDPNGRCASAAYSRVESTVISAWNNPRFQGAMQAWGGLAEAGAGMGYIYGSGGLGALAGGGLMIAHGIDNMATGVSQMLYGQAYNTLTSQLLQKSNLSPTAAGWIDCGIGCLGAWNRDLGKGASFIGSLFRSPLENHLLQLESKAARQQFLNELSRNAPRKAVNITTDYRKNLIRYTGFDPGKVAEAHHVFPQKYRTDFVAAGINIDNPKYLVWLEKNFHRAISKNYNDQWRNFIRDNEVFTIPQALEMGKRAMYNTGIPLNY